MSHLKPIKIKKKNRGLFTKKAKLAGLGVQAYAAQKKDAPGVLGKEARFAQNFGKNYGR